MGLIFWGCRRKLVEQVLPRVHDGSQTRTCVTGSRGEICPLGIDAARPAGSRENLISSVAALLRSLANVPVIVSARPRAFALFGSRAASGDGPRVHTRTRPSGGAEGGLGGLVMQGEGGDRANMVCARVLTCALVKRDRKKGGGEGEKREREV